MKKKSVRVYFHAILRVHFRDLESGPHTPVNIKSIAPPGSKQTGLFEDEVTGGGGQNELPLESIKMMI